MELAKAEQLAWDIMDEYNLTPIWSFSFDNGKRRFGCCNHTIKRISLSRELVRINSEERVEETIRHEVAHALAGAGEGHGKVWRDKCAIVGIKPRRCYSEDNTVCVKPKFKGTCPNCGRVAERHRRNQIACGKCCNKYNGGKWDEKYLFKWTRNT